MAASALNTPRLSTKSLSPEIASPGRSYGNDYAEIRPLLLDYRKVKAENDRLALRTKGLQERLEASERQYRELAVQNEFLTRQYAELHRAAFSKSPPLSATSHTRSLEDSGNGPYGRKLRQAPPSQAASSRATQPADRSAELLARPLSCTAAFPSPATSPVRTKIAGRLRSLPLVEPNTVARRRISIEKALPRSASTGQLRSLAVPTPPAALGTAIAGAKVTRPSPPLPSDHGPLRRSSSASHLAPISETPGNTKPKLSPCALDDALPSLPALKIGHRVLEPPTPPISRLTEQRSVPCQVSASPKPRQFADVLDSMGRCHHAILDQLAKEGGKPCGTDTLLSVPHRQQYHAFLQACLQSCHHAFGGSLLGKDGEQSPMTPSRPASSSTPLSLSTPQSPIAAVSHGGGGLSFTLTSTDQCMLSSFDHSLVASPTVSYSSEPSIATDPLLITLNRPSVDTASAGGTMGSSDDRDGSNDGRTDGDERLGNQCPVQPCHSLPLSGKQTTIPADPTHLSAGLFVRARQWLSSWCLGSVRQYRLFLSHPITALAVARYLWLDGASFPTNALISMTVCSVLLLVVPRVALIQRTLGPCNAFSSAADSA